MPSRTKRHLELLALSHPLHRYASALQPDVNASLFLVHRAMSKAFAEGNSALRSAVGLEASLRADIDSFMSSDVRV